ncbi:MAG: hypothetical protein MZV64_58820 [Ignavibacteriales bacterium]|nr:hypothetical protein [Ignavibacteriales bacterium]
MSGRRRVARGSAVRCGKGFWLEEAQGQGADRGSPASRHAGADGDGVSSVADPQVHAGAGRQDVRG